MPGHHVHHLGDGGEAGGLLVVFDEVLEAPEDQHAHGHQGEEEAQVLPAGPHRVGDGLEAHWPPGQLEDPHDPRDTENLEWCCQ